MAIVTFASDGMDIFSKAMEAAPEDLKEAVKAGAELLKTYTKETGQMIEGPYRTGQTLAALTVKTPGIRGGNPTCYVTYTGVNRKGNRNAEVAFLNEYGARGKAARPFNLKAVQRGENAILQRMEEIISAN